MMPSADQVAAFQANGGFSPATVSTVVLGFVFAVLLLWGVSGRCAPPMSAGPRSA
jgi:integrating conjugative element protein (TIGR03758 family)